MPIWIDYILWASATRLYQSSIVNWKFINEGIQEFIKFQVNYLTSWMRVNAVLEYLWISCVHYAVTPPSIAYAFPLTSVQVNCNYNFLSWVTLFSTLIALINLMYLVATWTRLLWLGILLGVLFLRLAMTEATAMTSLGRHDTSSARRSRPHHKNIPQCLLVHQCLVSSWTVSSCLSRLWF